MTLNSVPIGPAIDAGTCTDAARLIVVATHPIQYYAPYYRALSTRGNVSVHAIFLTRVGLSNRIDPGLGVAVTWKTDLLAGYSHEFLPDASDVPDTSWTRLEARGIVEALERNRPDVVLLHGITNYVMLRALRWCRSNGVPALMMSDSSLHTGTARWQAVAKRIVWPRIYQKFAGFLSVGDANQRYLETYGVPRERIFRVPNMVDEGFWKFRAMTAVERGAQRRKMGLADTDFAVLFVGKLIERKRPGDLIAALRHLKSMAPSKRRVRLLFAGSGVLMAQLKAEVDRDGLPADFLGFVNIDELPKIYAAADALAHPAEVETFGVIVLEAAILGLPLVLSDRVGAIGPTSIARSGENTITHAVGDTVAIASALHGLASDETSAARLRAASLRISEELDWRAAVGGTKAAIAHSLRQRQT